MSVWGFLTQNETMKNQNSSQPSYVSSTYGKIYIEVNDNGVVCIKQVGVNGDSQTLFVSPMEMEKLAKGLFAVKKKNFPPDTTTQTSSNSYMSQQKATHQQAYKPWTIDEEEQLKSEVAKGLSIAEMATIHERNTGAIQSRLTKLGLS